MSFLVSFHFHFDISWGFRGICALEMSSGLLGSHLHCDPDPLIRSFQFHQNLIHPCSTGNDPELDPNRPPAPPAKAVDRPVPRIGKRDAPKEAPSTQPRENAGRRGGRVTGGNDAGMWMCQFIKNINCRRKDGIVCMELNSLYSFP